MEDVLDLYAEPYDPKRPKINFDKASKQLIAETHAIVPTCPGQVEGYDYKYEGNGTVISFSSSNRRRAGGTSP